MSRAGVWRREGFDDWVGDNGAWADYRAWIDARKREGLTEAEAIGAWMAGGWREVMFNDEAFERFLEWCATQPPPRWVVLPDIVGAGMGSLALSLRYVNRCLAIAPLVLIAVQDGMEPAELAPYVGLSVGIFLGGSTPWKLAQAVKWGTFCAQMGVYFHLARCNTLQRFALAHDAGAASIDGSSATRFEKTLELLERGRKQGSLLDPRRRFLVSS